MEINSLSQSKSNSTPPSSNTWVEFSKGFSILRSTAYTVNESKISNNLDDNVVTNFFDMNTDSKSKLNEAFEVFNELNLAVL